MNSMKKPHTAENGDLIHTTEDNEASDISIITISFVRKTNKQILKKFESLPKTLQAQVSKPSANPEVNQAVFNGDIKTHKEY